jgi:acyl carrier protein
VVSVWAIDCDTTGDNKPSHTTEKRPHHLEKGESPAVDNEAAFDKFRACAVEVLQVPAEKITLEAKFTDDLEADSLEVVELVMALEEAFDITVEESELDGVDTIGQAFELVTSKIG